jgi:hypothetical protein
VVYDILVGGATSGSSIRAEIVRLPDGQPRELYYDAPGTFEYEQSVRWASDDVVVIDGHRLSAADGRFDFRYDTSPWLRWGVVAGISGFVLVVGLGALLVLAVVWLRPKREGERRRVTISP